MDISHYIAPGYSYSDFLKSYKAKESKGYFCYDYLKSTNVLNENKLPPYDAFYSKLKAFNVLEHEHIEWRKRKGVVLRTSDDNVLKKTELSHQTLSYLNLDFSQRCAHCTTSPCSCAIEPNTGIENYRDLSLVWKEKGMKTLKDFLIYYNLKDVQPFVEAVENLQQFYIKEKIDLLKDTISVPGAARKLLFRNPEAKFALFDHDNEDLFVKIKQNIFGGPAIVYSRYMSENQVLKDNPNILCQNIVGYDSNSLYPFSLAQEMPCGAFVRRLKTNRFKPIIQEKYLSMYIWMDGLSELRGIQIKHKLNSGKEHYIHGFYVDGIYKKEVFEYYSCYYHGCQKCYDKEKANKTDKWKSRQKNRLQRTLLRKLYLEHLGYKVTEIFECDFKQQFGNSIQSIKNTYLPVFYQKHKGEISKDTIIKAILSGDIFGIAEVDITVPERWNNLFSTSRSPYEYFKEFSPIFCATEVDMKSIGPHMTEHLKAFQLSLRPRKLLIGGMKAEKIMLSTPLLQWYLKHGLEITELYEVIEFSGKKCFEPFVDRVTEARRAGDRDSDIKLLSETMKLISNSAFGSCIMNKANFSNIKFVNGECSAKLEVNKPQFRKLVELDDDIFEIEAAKDRIRFDVPIQIGFFVLNYAKLRMLQFYYDFLCKFSSPELFECIQMDTDSLYLGIAGPDLESIILPEKKYQYDSLVYKSCFESPLKASGEIFLPRKCCEKHILFDKRTPGLMKIESEGKSMFALCSKTYVLKNKKGFKLSCKGVNKKLVQDPHSIMQQVLSNQKPIPGAVKGFRLKGNNIFTYTQNRIGFNYFYCKRQVLADGIHTIPLDICLTPWAFEHRFLIKESTLNPLALSFPFKVSYKSHIFSNIEQYLAFRLLLFHGQETKALEVRSASLFTTRNIVKQIQKHDSWYGIVDEILEEILTIKLKHCKAFETVLKQTQAKHLIYVHKDRYLGSGLTYQLTMVTKTKHFPGHNKIGLQLEQLRTTLTHHS